MRRSFRRGIALYSSHTLQHTTVLMLPVNLRVQQCSDKPCSGLFTAEDVPSGNVVYSVCPNDVISEVYSSVSEFEKQLRTLSPEARADVLRHSIPGVEKVFVFRKGPVFYENHSFYPTVNGVRWDLVYEQKGGDFVVDKRALRDLKAGEEITVDYDECVGYDSRTDSNMKKFLELCREHNVHKSPKEIAELYGRSS